MKKYFSFIKSKYKNIFTGLIFIIAVAILIYVLPREAKFKFDFQKNNPWMYETLIAPYDFPIYKTKDKIKNEKDSLLESVKPYFRFDTSVYKSQVNSFTSSFNNKSEEYKKQKFSENSNDLKFKEQFFEKIARKYFSIAMQHFKHVYTKGIIAPSEVRSQLNKDSEIVLMKDKVGREISFSKLYEPKEAYKYVITNLEEYTDSLDSFQNKLSDESKTFFDNLSFYEYIKPNVFYDSETSSRIKEDKLGNFSNTKGLVQAGERIVSKGEIVDGKTYQILNSLKKAYEQRLGSNYHTGMIFLGQVIFVFASIFVLYLFLYHFRNEILQDVLKTVFIIFLVVIFALVSGVTLRISPQSVYILPFAILPIIIRSFYDARLALFIHIITILIIGFYVPNSFEFVFLNFIVGIVALFSLTSLNRRGKLFLSAALVILSYSFVYFGLAIRQEGNIENIDWMNFAYFGINGAIVLASYPLIYLFEKLFGFLSDVTLMEMADTNQPLLRKLSEKAPGTFQHSLQVASLAETAVYQIGGNPLLVRTGAMYHDIGKMDNPIYFIENQDANFNPHERLEFEESAKIIINHVNKGVEIAIKNRLPSPIIDFIQTHHGTTKVQYFYRKFLQKYNEEEVDISQFTYPGPKPYSKEMAVLMMADSVEAASRSYSSLDEKTINNLVDNIIDSQLSNGQFENVDITLRDITIIKGIFKKKLQNFYHARIEYPEQQS